MLRDVGFANNVVGRVDLSVIICTWNRADSLAVVLESLRSVEIPVAVQWELVVVNNACTDHTDEVLGGYQGELPIRRVIEREPGLSNARNCAIEAARGDLIAWTDDDVYVDRRWITALMMTARRFPEAGFFGGPIEPVFEALPPRWLAPYVLEFTGAWGIRNFGADDRLLHGEEKPFGANMMFRRRCFENVRFNVNYGRTAGRMLTGEETDLVARLVAQGEMGAWAGGALIKHRIPAAQLTRAHLWSCYVGVGRFKFCQRARRTRGSTVYGALVLLNRYIWAKCGLYAAWAMRSGSWPRQFMKAARLWGMFSECVDMLRKR